MKHQKKLTSEEQQQQQTAEQKQNLEKTALEFASVDEMIRHDALHTPVPPGIARRLGESVAQAPNAPRPWWRRLLGE